jgi:hypothetical protein
MRLVQQENGVKLTKSIDAFNLAAIRNEPKLRSRAVNRLREDVGPPAQVEVPRATVALTFQARDAVIAGQSQPEAPRRSGARAWRDAESEARIRPSGGRQRGQYRYQYFARLFLATAAVPWKLQSSGPFPALHAAISWSLTQPRSLGTRVDRERPRVASHKIPRQPKPRPRSAIPKLPSVSSRHGLLNWSLTTSKRFHSLT